MKEIIIPMSEKNILNLCEFAPEWREKVWPELPESIRRKVRCHTPSIKAPRPPKSDVIASIVSTLENTPGVVYSPDDLLPHTKCSIHRVMRALYTIRQSINEQKLPKIRYVEHPYNDRRSYVYWCEG